MQITLQSLCKLLCKLLCKSPLLVQEISADFHGKTADLDERMPVAMVVAMETPVSFGYGPHLKYPTLPWKQACLATTLKYPETVQVCRYFCIYDSLKVG